MNASVTPRVSVIIPCFNAEPYCEEAVRSILEQDYRDLCVIAVNDGSSDRTAAILDALAAEDSRLMVIHQENGGIVAALNVALTAARGDYIARMDADDVSFPHRISMQVAYLDTHPDCVLVGGIAIASMDARGAGKGVTGGRHKRTDLSVFPPKVAVSVHPLIMVRRSAMIAIGGYSSAYAHAEDIDLFLRLAPYGTIDNPPDKILFYRRHEGAVSNRYVEQQEDSAVNAELDAIRRAGISLPSHSIIRSYRLLRKFRRYIDVDLGQARRLLFGILALVLDISPLHILSRHWWRLRLIAVVQLYRYVRVRTRVARRSHRDERVKRQLSSLRAKI